MKTDYKILFEQETGMGHRDYKATYIAWLEEKLNSTQPSNIPESKEVISNGHLEMVKTLESSESLEMKQKLSAFYKNANWIMTTEKHFVESISNLLSNLPKESKEVKCGFEKVLERMKAPYEIPENREQLDYYYLIDKVLSEYRKFPIKEEVKEPWISVEDRLPDVEDVFLTFPVKYGYTAEFHKYGNFAGCWTRDDIEGYEHEVVVLFWQQLPPAPVNTIDKKGEDND